MKESGKSKKKRLNMKRNNARPEELIESEIYEDSILREIEKIKGIDVKKTPFESSFEAVILVSNPPKNERNKIRAVIGNHQIRKNNKKGKTIKKRGKGASKWLKSKSNKPKKSKRERETKPQNPIVFHKNIRKEVKSIDIVPRNDISRKYIQKGNKMYCANNENQYPSQSNNHNWSKNWNNMSVRLY